MTGTFIDSILICTLTGLTLVITGIWTTDTSAALMTQGALAQCSVHLVVLLYQSALYSLLLQPFLVGIIMVNVASNFYLVLKA